MIFSASFTSAFFTSTLSSMDTPALRLVDPSSLMMPLLASSGAPLRTLTAVFLFPVTMTMAPTLMPSMSISSGFEFRDLDRPVVSCHVYHSLFIISNMSSIILETTLSLNPRLFEMSSALQLGLFSMS